MYKEYKCTQGSPEWFIYRKKLILTCSDFGIVTGNNPFKTYEQLMYDRKNNIKNECNINMLKGIQLEPKAREWYCNKYNKKVRETGILVPDWCKYIGGSLDGIVEDDDGIIEIKCPYKMYDFNSEDNPTGIKLYHYDQIQGYLAITEKKWCDYIVYTEDKVIVKRILRNEIYWNNFLYPKILKYIREYVGSDKDKIKQ